jgi:hypothetical protein
MVVDDAFVAKLAVDVFGPCLLLADSDPHYQHCSLACSLKLVFHARLYSYYTVARTWYHRCIDDSTLVRCKTLRLR